MKVILTGSQDISDERILVAAIQAAGFFIREAVTADNKGADLLASRWANRNSIPVRQFRTPWANTTHPQAIIRIRTDKSVYNAAAPTIRNQQMIEQADAAIIITNGSHEQDLIERAKQRGLPTYIHSVPPPIRGLSLWRPWPYAIFHCGKDIENRNYPAVVGQWVALHATHTWDKDGAEFIAERAILPPKRFHPCGAIVGVAKIAEIITEDSAFASSPWFFGPYGWKLENVLEFKTFIPAPGQQRLWTLTGELQTAIRAAYKEAIDVKSNLS